MPLLDGAFLPPTVFVLSHVLGVAGILFWTRWRREEGTVLYVTKPVCVDWDVPASSLESRNLLGSARSGTL